ncbi:MAG: alpha-hydroxy acid oxidase, partial [Pseudomonadota bacterium]
MIRDTIQRALFRARAIHSADDAAAIAQRRLPSMVLDYVDGAAGQGNGESANRKALRDIRLQTRVLRNVAERDLSHSVFGRKTGVPFGIAPMGFCNIVTHGADLMLARAAAKHNFPVCASTVATTSLEDIAEAANGHAWFQLYYSGRGELTDMLLGRAEAAGYDVLIFTVDVPLVGRRGRELRHGFKLPFKPSAAQLIDFALHPRWAFKMAMGGQPSLGNFGGQHPEFDRHATRAHVDFGTLKAVRDRWKGKLVVKGVLSTQDAIAIRQTGADAIQVSSHGGRQLDSAPLPINALPAIRKALGGDYPIFCDSGLRSGEDIIKALGRGADFAFMGRPFLHAIAAGG